MCKLTSYSRYQKRAIKFLNEFLGTSRPFTYEKANNNHLKVLIQGVRKPIYTGCTPSDCRSIKEFMAEVKRAVKESDKPLSELEEKKGNVESSVASAKRVNVSGERQDKVVQSVVRAMRNRIEVIKTKEEEMVLESMSLDEIGNSRKSVIKEGIDLAIKSNRQGAYFTQKELKTMSQSVEEHLDFMLPTIAYYSDKIHESTLRNQHDRLVKPTITAPISQLSENGTNSSLIRQEKANIELTSEKSRTVAKVQSSKKRTVGKSNPIEQLIDMNVKARQLSLRQLTPSQAQRLISDIEKAMDANREQDIHQVIDLIKEKQLCIDEIVSRLVA